MKISNNGKVTGVAIVKQENINDDLNQYRMQIDSQVLPPMNSSQAL